MTWASQYREQGKDKEITIEGLEGMPPVRVRRNSAVIIYRILGEKYDVTDFSPEPMKALLRKYPIDIIYTCATEYMLKPTIHKTVEEAREAEDGLTFDEFDLKHHWDIFNAILDDFAKGGAKTAEPFPGDGTGGASGSGELSGGDDPERVSGTESSGDAQPPTA